MEDFGLQIISDHTTNRVKRYVIRELSDRTFGKG